MKSVLQAEKESSRFTRMSRHFEGSVLGAALTNNVLHLSDPGSGTSGR